jgi:hypothetical protein
MLKDFPPSSVEPAKDDASVDKGQAKMDQVEVDKDQAKVDVDNAKTSKHVWHWSSWRQLQGRYQKRRRTHTCLTRRPRREQRNWPMQCLLAGDVGALALLAVYLGDQPRKRPVWLRRVFIAGSLFLWFVVGLHLVAIVHRRFFLRRPLIPKALPFLGAGLVLLASLVEIIQQRQDLWLIGLVVYAFVLQGLLALGILFPRHFSVLAPFRIVNPSPSSSSA